MDLEETLRRLPAAHVTLLLLTAGGFDDLEISDALDVPPEALPTMRDLARRKLGRIVSCATIPWDAHTPDRS